MEELETAVANILQYDAELAESINNVDFLNGAVDDVRNDVQIIERAIGKVEEFRDEVRAFNDDLDKLEFIFSLMGKASALRPFANTGKKIVNDVENVVDKFEDRLNDIVRKLENSSVRQNLQTADENLGKVQGALDRVSAEIEGQKAAFGSITEIAAKIATFTPAAVQSVGDLIETPLAVVQSINDVFHDNDDADVNSVVEYIEDFNTLTPEGNSNLLIEAQFELDKVLRLLDDFRQPLNAVYNVLKPIEPLLQAVDFVASITVDPVIDFVTRTLGVEKLINAASAKVTSLLPLDTDLDGFSRSLDSITDALDIYDFNVISSYDFDGDGTNEADPLDVGRYFFDNLQAKLVETVVNGVATKIGTLNGQGGPAIEIPNGVRGADDDDVLFGGFTPPGGTQPIPVSNLVMIGDDQDNLITATGGVNALYGAEGNDTLQGADDPNGEDVAVFSGPLGQYTFTREDDTAPVIVEHTSPIPGISLDGQDTLINIERVSFLGGASQDPLTFTIEQLFGQVAQTTAGTTLSRAGDSDAVFLFAQGSSATTTELEGGSGNDLLSGTTSNDRLAGNDGDDDLRSEGGQDTLDGGDGTDTFSYFGSDNVSDEIRVDLATPIPVREGLSANFTTGTDNQVTLIDVENVVIDGLQPTFMFGDDEDNALTSAGTRTNSRDGESGTSARSGDLIDGRGGNDVLRGGDGEDVLIGGLGIDSLYGGRDNDDLVVADVAVVGGDQFYDGGEGFDRLIYSGDLGGTGGTDGRRPLDRRDFLDYDENFVLTRARDQAESSGPVRVLGDGRVERLSLDGTTVLAVDTAVNIEGYVGSSFNDTLIGTDDTGSLLGDEGDDLIIGRGASGTVNGGGGTDTVYAGTGGGTYEGGRNDILYLNAPLGPAEFRNADEEVPAVRWYVQEIQSGNKRLQAFDARDRQDISSEGGFTKYLPGNIDGFGTIIGGDFDDEFDITRAGAGTNTIRAGGGNDDIQAHVTGTGPSNGQTYALFGEDGDDTIRINHAGTVDGGADEDQIYVLVAGSQETTVTGGGGNDFIYVQRANSDLDGGEDAGDDNDDLDYIASHPNMFEAVDIDLLNGTMTGLGGGNINATLRNFEGAIGGDGFNDRIRGGSEDEVLIGGSGNDLIEGRSGESNGPTGGPSGNDLLYGGDGQDSLFGGDGDDVLHGGQGNDLLDGGAGIDTASYELGAPGADSAALEVSAHSDGGVRVDLEAGTARHVSGSSDGPRDTLINIENLTGSVADDILFGDGGANVLQGAEGADSMDGRGGDDTFVILGDDTVIGGADNDYFSLGAGNADIQGGSGQDTLQVEDEAGTVEFNATDGTYVSTFDVDVPVWADTGTTELRPANPGTSAERFYSPQDVLEIDPAFATSATPQSAPDGAAFEIVLTQETRSFSGTFDGIEDFIGGTLVGGAPTGGDDAIGGNSGNDAIAGLAGDDLIAGNEGDDMLSGQAGDDTVNGGEGLDTAEYTGNQAGYTLTLFTDLLTTGNYISTVQDRSGVNGSDRITGIELLDFDVNTNGEPFDLLQFGGSVRVSESEMENVVELYIAYFNRAPDAIGVNFWGTAFANGTTLEEMAALFIDQDEYRADYPEGLTNDTFVDRVYDNALGRAPDSVGKAFWVEVLDDGSVTRDQFILEILRGARADPPPDATPEFRALQERDQKYLTDKIDVGADFAIIKGMSDVVNAKAVMELFTGSEQSIEAAAGLSDVFFSEAQAPFGGEFLMPLVGVIADPFA